MKKGKLIIIGLVVMALISGCGKTADSKGNKANSTEQTKDSTFFLLKPYIAYFYFLSLNFDIAYSSLWCGQCHRYWQIITIRIG